MHRHARVRGTRFMPIGVQDNCDDNTRTARHGRNNHSRHDEVYREAAMTTLALPACRKDAIKASTTTNMIKQHFHQRMCTGQCRDSQCTHATTSYHKRLTSAAGKAVLSCSASRADPWMSAVALACDGMRVGGISFCFALRLAKLPGNSSQNGNTRIEMHTHLHKHSVEE